jgi:hypothetical protein
MMDTTEGPCRMRKKLIRNEMSYIHYPFTGELVGRPGSPKLLKRINPPISKDSKEFYKKFKHQSSFVMEAICGSGSNYGIGITSVSSVDESSEDATSGSQSPATTTLCGGGGGGGSTSSDPNLSPPRSQCKRF